MNPLLLLLLCLLGLALAAPLPDLAAQRDISTLTTGSPSPSPPAAPTGAITSTITVSGTWTVFPPPASPPAAPATGKSAEHLHIGSPHIVVPFDTEGHITGSADSGHVGAPASFPASVSSPPAASPDANYSIRVPHPHTVHPRSSPSAEGSCVGAPRCRLSSSSSSSPSAEVAEISRRALLREDGGVEAEEACVGSPHCIHGQLPSPSAEGGCVGCPEGGHAGGV